MLKIYKRKKEEIITSNKHANETEFDEITEKYDEQIPKYIRNHLCNKKVNFLLKKLEEYGGSNNYAKPKGLDVGCGTGWHVKKFLENGIVVYGIDTSEKMINQAKKNNNNVSQFVVALADNVPFKNGVFDFIYFINVLHHLTRPEEQQKSIEEAYRLLKSKGIIFFHEVNESFFLFKFYMKYVFPLTNKIHHGKRKERYLDIKQILNITKNDWLLVDITYFTFLPNITPLFIFPILKKFEAFLEKITKNKFGGHWLLTLKKLK